MNKSLLRLLQRLLLLLILFFPAKIFAELTRHQKKDLHLAVQNKDLLSVINLLTAYAKIPPTAPDVNYLAFKTAIDFEDVESVSLFIQNNYGINKYIGSDMNAAVTPLMEAAIVGNVQIVELLLKNGARTDLYILKQRNPKDKNGTALHWAVKSNNAEVVKVLLMHGADVNSKEDYDPDWFKEDITPLYWALNHHNRKIVELLLQAGAKE